MKVYYSANYTIPLPPGHRFPMEKYRLLRDTLLARRILSDEEISEAPLATESEVRLAHAPAYVDGILDGTIDPRLMRRIGFPWSRDLVLRSLATVGGQIAAARTALEYGISGNLAGGTHHAKADAGEGFCVFNDIAVAALRLLQEGAIRRAAIIDLDVHQGNGNSDILAGRDDVFVFSMHGEKNFPFIKVPSTWDIGLADGCEDQEYLAILKDALPRVLAFDPDLVFYQAGVDPLAEDSLGKLKLTKEGLAERDLLVLSACYDRGIPVSLSLGGGYAKPITHTVEAHIGTYRIAKQLHEGAFP